ncbi:hypothetical protein DM02DRAFT_665034 [Periconia macrospinosa]|uniref:BZIP domain-containing protein n=1 Tax=Periconia macrospinosa TaxID=97972 RepID=A0A2V1CXL8_9PLEO|nr:hypothetical protein DM02DRAFT_665034 [Periconia macrospinosa]
MAPRKYCSEAARKEARKEQNRKAQRRFRDKQKTSSVAPKLGDRSCVEEATDPRANAPALLEKVKEDVRRLVQLSHGQPDIELESYLAEQWNEVQGLVRWRQYLPSQPQDALQPGEGRATRPPMLQSTRRDGHSREQMALSEAFQAMRQMLNEMQEEPRTLNMPLWRIPSPDWCEDAHRRNAMNSFVDMSDG